MKKILILIIIANVLILNLFGLNKSTVKRIKKYSGKHQKELIKLLKDKDQEIAKYAEFILQNSSPNDLSALNANYLKENIQLAIKSRKISYANYPEDIFKHFVLPYRASQEPIENWRPKFYKEIYPIVKDAKSIEEAAILVNLWANEKMTFKQTHGRDQASLTTIKRGYGRCEEMMIIFIDAARSVGIPVRAASAPYWNFTDNNHAWVEIWTPDGWKYRGEPENSLNNSWFTNTTKRATLINSEAFGKFDSPDLIKYKNHASTINSTKYYNKPVKCTIKVVNKHNRPVKNADVNFYAVSWGGLFPFLNLKTDKNGIINIDLGKGSVYVTSKKNKLFGYSVFDNMKSNNLTIKLKKSFDLDDKADILFALPDSSPNPNSKREVLGSKFKYLKELSNLRREKRLHNYLKPLYFADFYDTINQDKKNKDYDKDRKKFVEQCNKIEGNISQFVKVINKLKSDKTKEKIIYDMLDNWDTKELVEIPDSTMIEKVVDIYSKAKNKFSDVVPDSIFTKYVVGFTWRSFTPPQNGWQPEFVKTIQGLESDNIESIVKKVVKYFDKNLKVDKKFEYSYFSGTLNPNQIINMHYVPKSYKMKTVNCALKLLGVPIRWKGRLEYYNSREWKPVYDEKKDKKEYREFSVEIFIDGKQVKAEPWKNFLIGEMSMDNGEISNTYFDGKNDSLRYVGKYLYSGDPVYLESEVRNSNGDANLVIKSFSEKANQNVKIYLKTPKEFVDKTDFISVETKEKILSYVKSKSKTMVFVTGNEKSEPVIRMYNQLISASNKINKNKMNVVLVTDKKISDNFNLSKINHSKIIYSSKFENKSNNYPEIFLIDKQKIIFSTKGFNLGIIDLILKK